VVTVHGLRVASLNQNALRQRLQGTFIQFIVKMSGNSKNRGKNSKVQIHGSKPELPTFLQRMKEQIVESENKERQIRNEKRQREKPGGSKQHDEDDPTIVQLEDGDVSEAEYKRIKMG
jgi:hypothetical protein